MSSYWLVLGFAALPALGNLAGGVLAELLRVSQRALSLALHLAAGIVLAVVGMELMPEALNGTPPWLPLLAFVAGGAVFTGLDRSIGYIQARLGRRKASGDDNADDQVGKGQGEDGEHDEKQASALAIFSGVSIDLFSDGVMIGTGTVVNPALGLLLALG